MSLGKFTNEVTRIYYVKSLNYLGFYRQEDKIQNYCLQENVRIDPR